MIKSLHRYRNCRSPSMLGGNGRAADRYQEKLNGFSTPTALQGRATIAASICAAIYAILHRLGSTLLTLSRV